MPIINQQSSILTEQELQLLASYSPRAKRNSSTLYSFQCDIKLPNCQVYLSHSIEQLILQLSGSPRGCAAVLPDNIESNPALNELTDLFVRRADIRVFWLGKLPSMETNLPVFVHCSDKTRLRVNVSTWQNYIERTFSAWLAQYSVAFITNNDDKKRNHQCNLGEIGLKNVEYFTASSVQTQIKNHKLLIIDLEATDLYLTEVLNHLANNEQFPIVIIYGQLPANICRATYTLIENHGFPILASLTSTPDKAQWNKLFSSLFSKVYLKHWINEEPVKTGAYKLHHVDKQSVFSYFCLHGMTKKQIAALPKPDNIRHIISARSLQDWFPDGIKREIREQLSRELHCGLYGMDICIESPERIQRSSLFFSALVMARLLKTKVYWSVMEENNLLNDILKNFPISDVILSESLSHQLLNEPSEILLEFIEQAQNQQVNLVATLQPSSSTDEALALYGIESVLDKQSYIE